MRGARASVWGVTISDLLWMSVYCFSIPLWSSLARIIFPIEVQRDELASGQKSVTLYAIECI